METHVRSSQVIRSIFFRSKASHSQNTELYFQGQNHSIWSETNISSWLLQSGTKRRTQSFSCSRLIIFDLKTKNVVSVFSRNESEKPTKQSSNLEISNSFLEGRAVIDKGDYLFFKQVFIPSKVFLRIIPILTKRKDAHFKPQSKSQRQSSCHYAVIIDIGYWGKAYQQCNDMSEDVN